MEELLKRIIKQTVPTHAMIFIIISIVSLFIVTILILGIMLTTFLSENSIRVDLIIFEIIVLMGYLGFITVGVASIFDYKKAVRQCLENVKKNEIN